jgi:cytochrome c-type biogenesis protein CcsB
MLKKVFSMKVAVITLVLFGVIIGVATFIENDYGTQTARALIYSAKWFELFLFFFTITLIYNIFKYKTYKKEKLPIFIFHFAFVIIAIGALITRYIGYEGIMHIREGQTSNIMVSDVKVFQVDIEKDGKRYHYEKQPIFLSSMTKNHLSVEHDGVEVDLIDYKPSVVKQLVEDNKSGREVVLLKASSGSAGEDIELFSGDIKDMGSFIISFNKEIETQKPIFNIISENKKLKVKTNFPLQTLSMETREEQNLSSGVNSFEKRKLYRFGSNMVVLKDYYPKASFKYVQNSLKTKSGFPEMSTFRVSYKDKSKDIDIFSFTGQKGEFKKVDFGDVKVYISLGAKVIELPFYLKLIDFQLERYPGSMSPSSYASEVEVIDKERGVKMPFRIYMNHVLDYRGYRFFQSSYDMDEKGTILSVNHDPGTMPTYIGYILLALGMLLTIFTKKGRFQTLLRRVRKIQNSTLGIVLLLFISSTPIYSFDITENNSTINRYDKEMVDEFARLIVQDSRGRMKPIDTLSHEIISKLTGKTSIYGADATSIFLGMMTNPRLYQNIPMIKISHTRVAKELGLPKGTKYAKFKDFFTDKGEYKLLDSVSNSARKKPLDKNKYDNELIKIDERLNIAYMVYTGSFLKIYPVPHDPNNKWVDPKMAIQSFPKDISSLVRQMSYFLFNGIDEGLKDGNWTQAKGAIKMIGLYQKKFGSKVLPSENEIEFEIIYNRLDIFAKLVPLYLLVGLVLLIASFINVVKPLPIIKKITKVAWVITIIGFILHVIGMGLRWYIAGHAPWSNAYESIIFIAGATVIAGLILAKNSPFTLGATNFLAGITMAVAHMNFINPEITNLVPVLKSYWLMIHVATIISGDGFLGLGSMLSLIVLILFIFRKKSPNIDNAIKELTYIAEMSLIIGLFLLTVGNFLGGVWANESWGRYWGWDSKETWAAVTILIYAGVLHLRFIKNMNTPFIFNVASLWAYSTVIMTYFGVNYYLSGLHSYAGGEPIPIPSWVYYAVAGLLILTLLAYRNRDVEAK